MSPTDGSPAYDNDFTQPEEENFIPDEACPGSHPAMEPSEPDETVIIPKEESDADR